MINGSKVWDTYTGDTLQTLSHDHIVRSSDISISQSLIATGGSEKILRVYDVNHGQTPTTVGSHTSTIKSVVWDRYGRNDKTIITSGDDKKIVWWDIRSNQPSSSYATEEMISSMEQTIDRKYITVTAGKTLLVFDSATYVSFWGISGLLFQPVGDHNS